MTVTTKTVSSGYSTGTINENFQTLEDYINNNLLNRDGTSTGEVNQLELSLDMNSNFVFNLPEPVLEHQAARLKDVQNAINGADQANLITFTPYGNISSENVQGAIQELVDGTGQSVTTSTGEETLAEALDGRAVYFPTVADMVAADAVSPGQLVITKQYRADDSSGGAIYEAFSDGTFTADGGVFVQGTGVQYRQIISDGIIHLSTYGMGSSLSSESNADIVAKACARAREIPSIHTIMFPAGTFDIDRFELDVDKRGFSFLGAGRHLTNMVSKSSSESFVLIRIDPRDRNRDGHHDYQTVDHFAINGDIQNRGALAATKSVIQSNYAEIGYKSVGHVISNIDVNGLVSNFYGHTGGQSDGTNFSAHSLRLRNNAIKCDGRAYCNGAAGHSANALTVDDGATTLASDVLGTDTTIEVDSSNGLEKYDRIEIGPSGSISVRYIVDKSGTTLTLDDEVGAAYSTGDQVRLPVVSNSFRGTIETGTVRLVNPIGFVLDATYSEEAQVLMLGYHENTMITGISSVETNPAIQIDRLDRRSVVTIRGNRTSARININVENRNGNVDTLLDLNEFPEIDIDMNTRPSDRITINGTSGYSVSRLRVVRAFNFDLLDRYSTTMEFDGYVLPVDGGSLTVTGMEFFLFPSALGYDGLTVEMDVHARRENPAYNDFGIYKIQGVGSTDGTTFDNRNLILSEEYRHSVANGGRVTVFVSGTVSRVTTRFQGESGPAKTFFLCSGRITNLT